MIELIPGGSAFAVDRRIKTKVEKTLTVGEEKDLAHGHLKLCLHHNYGVASNMGANNPVFVKILSVLISIIVSIIFLLSFGNHGTKTLRFGLSLLLGGAFSNTYDRLKNGYVTDYVRIMHGPKWFKSLIWNIADFAIIIGALVAAISDIKRE